MPDLERVREVLEHFRGNEAELADLDAHLKEDAVREEQNAWLHDELQRVNARCANLHNIYNQAQDTASKQAEELARLREEAAFRDEQSKDRYRDRNKARNQLRESEVRYTELLEAVKAFWETTDDYPIGPLTMTQADAWDRICEFIEETERVP